MTSHFKLLATVSGLATVALGATPAFAEGTQAGSTIQNTVTVNYKVDDIDQTAEQASDSFVVDRKINLTVAEEGTSTTTVTPGQTSAVTTFTVTNSSNAALDFGLAAAQLAGGAAEHGGTDSFDVANVRIYLDVNDDGVLDGGDAIVTYLDEVAADDSIRVFVVADVPLGLSTGDVAGVRLTATARESGAGGSEGAVVAETAGANTAGMDTVFADAGASGNAPRDGMSTDGDDYTILTAALTVEKTSLVISDPFNLTTNPKMIPGAVVEYCVAVTNAAGGAAATNVSISDALPVQTVFDGSFTIQVDGTKTGSTCNDDGLDGGAHAAGVVSGDLSDIPAGNTRTMRFRVVVQ